MKKSIKMQQHRKVPVNFYYYQDNKSFLPLVAVFGEKLSSDENNVITIMRASNPKNVKKVKSHIIFK